MEYSILERFRFVKYYLNFNFLECNSFAVLHPIINYLYNFKFDSARNEYTKLFS